MKTQSDLSNQKPCNCGTELTHLKTVINQLNKAIESNVGLITQLRKELELVKKYYYKSKHIKIEWGNK